jgi:hypothetical protein
MKKLLLTIATGLAFAPVFAQSGVNSVMLNQKVEAVPMGEKAEVGTLNKFPGAANKTTAGGEDWFYMPGILSSAQSKLFYNVMYPDSNVVYSGSSGNVNVFMHGMGRSFDPTDSSYFSETTSQGAVQDADQIPSFRVTAGNAYTIDSIAFLGKYMRTTNNDDTLYLQVTKTLRSSNTVFGIYGLTFTTSGEHFGTTMYNNANNNMSDSIPSTSVQTIKIVLDAAFFADTSTAGGGRSNRTGNGIALTTPLTLNAGEVAIAYVNFKSSVNHPLGTTVANANTFRMYTWDFRGTDADPIQNKNSFEAGLVATNQLKYFPYTSGYAYTGHQVLIPHVAYTTEGLYTDFAFHVKCTTCPTLNVATVKGNILSANAYPNPAAAEVRVPFTLKAAADVNVTITNTVGQVVKSQNMGNTTKGEAVISVSDIANGVYFYTVDADGQRQTGRVVVNH